MSLSNVEKEAECVLHWFECWSEMQRSDFMKELVDKAVPNHVDALFDAMDSLNVKDKPPSIFQCQMKLFKQWFDEWTDPERNNFILRLQTINPEFVRKFNEEVDSVSSHQGHPIDFG